jgi:SOS response regulatory protein OraA/RecX
MAVVTALRVRGGRVAVELDGSPWRTLPLEAIVRAGLVEGCELHREGARVLARERRRLRALDVAARALRARDRTERELGDRLAARGVRPAEREQTLATLQRAGLLDDARFATTRAAALADRGYGDDAIRHDLERRGLAGEAVADAIGSLAPEQERAALLASRFGGGLRAARAMARRGFGEDALEDLIAGEEGGAVG